MLKEKHNTDRGASKQLYMIIEITFLPTLIYSILENLTRQNFIDSQERYENVHVDWTINTNIIIVCQ